MNELHFQVEGAAAFTLVPTRLVVAGWTGRDSAAIQHHIDELAAIGVPRPSAVPLYYRLARALLTQQAGVEVLGDTTSGEAEPVLVRHAGRWWLTVGSDHTDRAAETVSVALSKQACAKPLATQAWAWDDVAARADTLQLQSHIHEDGAWVLYQQGPLSKIRPLQSLVDGLPADVPVQDGLVLFCGTLGAIARADGTGIRPAARMRVALVDGARRISHDYRVSALPLVS